MGTQKKDARDLDKKGAVSPQPPARQFLALVFSNRAFPTIAEPGTGYHAIGHRAFTIRAIVTFKALALYREKL